MAKYWVICAAMVLSVNLAYAAKSDKKVNVSPAPPELAKETSPDPPMLIKDPASGMELVYVKGGPYHGCYKMGDSFGDGGPEEKPVHEVCVDDYYIGKYEVTQGQWKKIMGSNPALNNSCGDDCPVDNVSWNDVQNFINRLNSKIGEKKKSAGRFRLPTEAEWEYAARSRGENDKFSGGEALDVAWLSDNSENRSHPVGTKAPNGLGIYDMSGNVWEWTNDWYGSTYYSSSPRNNPTGPKSGERRALRGGSWAAGWVDARTSYRNFLAPDYRSGSIGFRLLKTR